jgi:hypothetical protein
MDIEHCGRLSWFSRKGESHEQDGEKLRARVKRAATASGDPAMAFMSSSVLRGRFNVRRLGGRPYCRPAYWRANAPAHNRADIPRGILLSGECRVFQ